MPGVPPLNHPAPSVDLSTEWSIFLTSPPQLRSRARFGCTRAIKRRATLWAGMLRRQKSPSDAVSSKRGSTSRGLTVRLRTICGNYLLESAIRPKADTSIAALETVAASKCEICKEICKLHRLAAVAVGSPPRVNQSVLIRFVFRAHPAHWGAECALWQAPRCAALATAGLFLPIELRTLARCPRRA